MIAHENEVLLAELIVGRVKPPYLCFYYQYYSELYESRRYISPGSRASS